MDASSKEMQETGVQRRGGTRVCVRGEHTTVIQHRHMVVNSWASVSLCSLTQQKGENVVITSDKRTTQHTEHTNARLLDARRRDIAD